MRYLSYFGSILIGLALVPALYLGLQYRRGQTVWWAPRWMMPIVQARPVKPPKLTPLVYPERFAELIKAPKAVQAKAGKLK